jgi:hypothetical protein
MTKSGANARPHMPAPRSTWISASNQDAARRGQIRIDAKGVLLRFDPGPACLMPNAWDGFTFRTNDLALMTLVYRADPSIQQRGDARSAYPHQLNVSQDKVTIDHGLIRFEGMSHRLGGVT